MLLIPLPPSLVPFLQPYLPTNHQTPFITLTWAQSLDARIAAEPGAQTKISHLETKTMTHYLRSKHDAILVGVGTVLADDPKLNCRYGEHSKIRPVVVDPNGKWNYSKSQLRRLCDNGNGLAPYIIVADSTNVSSEDGKILLSQGGGHVTLPLSGSKLDNWTVIFHALAEKGIQSIMVEGGADVINTLLLSNLVDAIIITVGPLFLGSRGVLVAPSSRVSLSRVSWWTGVQDSVMAAVMQ